MTDLHSHILPGVDDGSRSVEQSLSMLAAEAEQGVSRVVATPHFYPQLDEPGKFLARREAAAQRLYQAMAGRTGLPTVELGAEVHYFPGMSDCDELSQLTIGQKQCILIEMPEVFWTAKMYEELEQIWLKQGLTPVIAHIDRYIRPFACRQVMRQLERLPVLVQANAEFFLDRGTAGLALRLLRQERIHVLGSDCHNMEDRAPNMGAAAAVISAKLGAAALERIEGCSRQIV